MLECLVGCFRIILCQPRPLEADVAPSNLVLHRGPQAAGPEICDSPGQKFAFPTACRGGCDGQEGRAHVGKGLPVCPCTLGTLQGQSLVCGVSIGRASHSTPAPGGRFGPDFRQNRPGETKVNPRWRWNKEVSQVLECLVGCPRMILCQPRPPEADVAPSSPVLHRHPQAAGPEICDSPGQKFAFPMAR